MKNIHSYFFDTEEFHAEFLFFYIPVIVLPVVALISLMA